MGFWNNGGFFSSAKNKQILSEQNTNQDLDTEQNLDTENRQEDAGQYNSTVGNVLSGKPDGLKNQTEDSFNEQNISGSNAVSPEEDPMEVLKRIDAEREERRRKEIEVARQKAQEQARIDAIMNANKVDVDAFIEAGKAAQQEVDAQQDACGQSGEKDIQDKQRREDDLRKAQEIVERLNREAEEDEAKKQKEVEIAKQEANKRFG